MKVGDYVVQAGNEAEENKRKDALLTAPFADERNSFAKIAKNGKLIKDPEPETAPGAEIAANHYVMDGSATSVL